MVGGGYIQWTKAPSTHWGPKMAYLVECEHHSSCHTHYYTVQQKPKPPISDRHLFWKYFSNAPCVQNTHVWIGNSKLYTHMRGICRWHHNFPSNSHLFLSWKEQDQNEYRTL